MKRKHSPGCKCCKCDPLATFIDVTVTDFCTNLPVSGATVTVKVGTTTIGTGTTDASGEASVGVDQSGNYTVTITKAKYTTITFTVSGVTCGGTKSVTATLTPSVGKLHVTFSGGCNATQGVFGGGVIPGATVTVTQGATTIATGTTDSNGAATIVDIPISSSQYAVTVSNPAYSTQTASQNFFLGSLCQTVNADLTVNLDADYHCACFTNAGGAGGGTCLVGNQLLCSTPWGDCVLTWSWANKRWTGTLAGVPVCGGTDCQIKDSVTLTISYTTDNSNGCSWLIGGPCDNDPPATFGGWIPGGGDNRFTTDTGGGACSPFYAWTTITSHVPAWWVGLIGRVLWCSGADATYTFSVTEIATP